MHPTSTISSMLCISAYIYIYFALWRLFWTFEFTSFRQLVDLWIEKREYFYKQAAKAKYSIPKIILSLEPLTLLVAGTMWMSVSSHTCPSGSNSILMMALTGGRLVAIATVHYLKEILLCCGGVCEGHQPDQMWLQEREQHSRLPDTHRVTTDTHIQTTLRSTVSHWSGKQTLRYCFYRKTKQNLSITLKLF